MINIPSTNFGRQYKALIEKNFAESIADAARMRINIENSSAHYHGYTVHTLFTPKLYSHEDYAHLEKIAGTIYGILDKVIKEYIKNPQYRELFGFDERLESLILRPSLYDASLPIARIDLFYNPETRNFKFCEFNTDGSSGMNEDRELNNALDKSAIFKEFCKTHTVTRFEFFDSWVDEFTKIYKSSSAFKENARVAIVDFMSSASNEEFEEFKRAFKRRGYECEICDIYKLKRVNNRLISPDGNEIDVVYRRAVTCDIMENYDRITPFIEAAKNNEVVLIGDFKTQVAHNKLLFKILRDDMTKAFLTDSENEFIERHIPKTYLLTNETIEKYNVLEDKDSWIVKPADSYASKGVLAGVEVDDKEKWCHFIAEHAGTGYLLQEYVTPFKTENIDLVWDKNADFRWFSNITGMFVYNGRLQGLYSRIANNGVISTQYSEMTLATMLAENV